MRHRIKAGKVGSFTLEDKEGGSGAVGEQRGC